MFEIQSQTKQLWESEPRWGFIARHETLARCVEGIHRIVTPFAGDGGRNPDNYRVVERKKKGGKIVAVYNNLGQPVLDKKAPTA